jgi:preprotein translocase subunit SecG
MGFIIGLLTLVMVFDCIILIFLVLIQLPKKDAGAGLAFGAGATDALFGAGSGTVLTKITKYAAGGFFALALLLSILQGIYHSRNVSSFTTLLAKPPAAAPSPPQPAPVTKPVVEPATTNLPMTPPVEATNAAATATNSAALITNSPAAEATNSPATAPPK